MNQVDTAVARKTLDNMKQQGAAAVSLLESAAETQQAMVSTAVSEPHKGTLVDLVA